MPELKASQVEVAEAAMEIEAEEAGTQTAEVRGRSFSSSEYSNSERGDNDFKGSDKWADKHDGDREHRKDRFHDDDKQGSYKDSGYKGKTYDDEGDFKSKPYPKKEYNDPLQSPANPLERTGIIKTRGGGGKSVLTRCETYINYPCS